MRQRGDPSKLGVLLAGLCFTVAASFRFEAGYWAIVACLLILTPPERTFRPRIEKGRVVRALLFCLAAASYPTLLVARWWHLHGDPLHYFNATAINQAQFYASGSNVNWPDSIYIPIATSFWFLSVAAVLTPIVAFVALLGLARALRNATSGLVAAAVLCWLTLLTVLSVTRHFPLEYRYALPAYGLACLFLRTGMDGLASRFDVLARPRRQVVLAAVSIALFYGAYSWAAFQDGGVLGRRLGMLSPLRPGQYQTRQLLAWLEPTVPAQKVLVSPCVKSPTYSFGGGISSSPARFARSPSTGMLCVGLRLASL